MSQDFIICGVSYMDCATPDREPCINSLWKHIKTGEVYIVVSVSTFEEDLERMVTYRAHDKTFLWTRRMKVFLERFRKL